MGNVLREGRSCSAEMYSSRPHEMLREFQQKRKAVSLHFQNGNAKRLCPSFGVVPKIITSKDPVRRPSVNKSQFFTEYSPSSNSESESYSCGVVPLSINSKVLERRPSEGSTSRYTTVCTQSTLSESSRLRCSCSILYVAYPGDEEKDFGQIERGAVYEQTKCARCSKLDAEQQVEDDELIIPPIDTDESDGETLDETVSSPVRMRGNAIDLIPVESPGGKFLHGKEFWLQNPEGGWERVTIENWNHWNGTWQVRGADGTAFPAAPIALKTEEEYRFLSRERNVRSRSFKSFVDATPKSVKLSEF